MSPKAVGPKGHYRRRSRLQGKHVLIPDPVARQEDQELKKLAKMTPTKSTDKRTSSRMLMPPRTSNEPPQLYRPTRKNIAEQKERLKPAPFHWNKDDPQ